VFFCVAIELSTIARLGASFEIGDLAESVDKLGHTEIEATHIKIQFTTSKRNHLLNNQTFTTYLKEFIGKKLHL
jgi:hypothetical protein